MNAKNRPLSVFLWPNVLTRKDHFLVNVKLATLEMALSIAQVCFDHYNYLHNCARNSARACQTSRCKLNMYFAKFLLV